MAKWVGPGVAKLSGVQTLNPGDDVPDGFFTDERYNQLVEKNKIDGPKKKITKQVDVKKPEGDKK